MISPPDTPPDTPPAPSIHSLPPVPNSPPTPLSPSPPPPLISKDAQESANMAFAGSATISGAYPQEGRFPSHVKSRQTEYSAQPDYSQQADDFLMNALQRDPQPFSTAPTKTSRFKFPRFLGRAAASTLSLSRERKQSHPPIEFQATSSPRSQEPEQHISRWSPSSELPESTNDSPSANLEHQFPLPPSSRGWLSRRVDHLIGSKEERAYIKQSKERERAERAELRRVEKERKAQNSENQQRFTEESKQTQGSTKSRKPWKQRRSKELQAVYGYVDERSLEEENSVASGSGGVDHWGSNEAGPSGTSS